jgi:multiple sugar transport system ATP-binding protein
VQEEEPVAEIRIDNVTKVFGDHVAVDDANLVIADQEFLVLLGPSGCGKTTLLRAVAGLGMPDAGQISIGGRDVTYSKPAERNISMVFQSYAIFPHMTVRDNIGFGLKMKKAPEAEIRRNVDEAAELLHIEELLDRRPSDMSGGQRQRVAVARALAMKAEVLLMDEPLSNLDALLRLEMRAELKRLLQEVKATTIYVTHDQIEALSMGDRIAVMRDGVIQQVDQPSTVYADPVNRFVGGFIGNPPMNFLNGTVVGGQGDAPVMVELGDNRIVPAAEVADAVGAFKGRPITIGVRAENMRIIDGGSGHDGEAVAATVEVVEPLGSQTLLTIDVGGARLKVSTHPTSEVKADDTLWVELPPQHIRWIDPDTERVIG